MNFFLAIWVALAAFASLSAGAAADGQSPPVNPAAAGSTSATPASGRQPVLKDEYGRGVPRSTIENLWNALAQADYARATNYFDLSQVDGGTNGAEGVSLARKFRVIAERQIKPNFEDFSSQPAGLSDDGLPPDQDRIGRLEFGANRVDVLIERVPRADGVLVWKVSSAMVERVPQLYQKLAYRLLGSIVPHSLEEFLLGRKVLGLPMAEVVNLTVTLVGFLIALAVTSRLALAIIGRLRPGFFYHFLHTVCPPAVLLLIVLIIRSLFRDTALSDVELKLYQSQTGLVVAAIWLVSRLVDFASDRGRYELTRRGQSSSVPLVNLARRMLKVLLVIIGLTIWLENLGFRVTTILAGLGVAGIAVGLAGQKLIEDLFGAITLYGTRRVKREDLIRYGDKRGIVEDIGLRLTTIRSLDRTMITLPNGVFAQLEIENLSERDRFWFHPRLGLRYETTPDQIRYILVEVRKLLYAHPKVQNDGARVRFTNFGAYSLDLDIFCYVTETTYADYLGVAEDLNLRIMDIVALAGSGFAFPSQTTYYERGQGLDATLGKQAEEEVKKWRTGEELYLPNFPEAKIKELEGTVEYPPAGSPEVKRKASTRPGSPSQAA